MARQQSSGSRSYSKAKEASTKPTTKPRSRGPRRDWSKIALYTMSMIIVLSMLLGLFSAAIMR
jgi:hypothetical protein